MTPHWLFNPSPRRQGREQEKKEEEEKDHVADYYPPSSIYMASYEVDAPTLVNNLVPELITGERKETDRTEEDKAAEDRRDLIEITDKNRGEDNLNSDSDSDYFY